MKILDLFSGGGGAALGYIGAGHTVAGWDVKPITVYPGEFHQGDWRDGLKWGVEEWGADAVHASAPCQPYSITRHGHSVVYPALVEPVREALEATGLPYVMENVVGSPLRRDAVLCGTMFNLTATDTDGTQLFLKRHRLFEANFTLPEPPPCRCREWGRREGWQVGGVYGGARRDKWEARHIRRGGYVPSHAVCSQLMRIEGMPERLLFEAIPPRYTRWIAQWIPEH